MAAEFCGCPCRCTCGPATHTGRCSWCEQDIHRPDHPCQKTPAETRAELDADWASEREPEEEHAA